MEKIRGSVKFALLALAIITVVFAAVVSPWKGLSIATFPVIMTGLGCWIGSVILLFRGLGKRKIQPFSQMTGMAAILLVLAFVPVAYAYMVIRPRRLMSTPTETMLVASTTSSGYGEFCPGMRLAWGGKAGSC